MLKSNWKKLGTKCAIDKNRGLGLTLGSEYLWKCMQGPLSKIHISQSDLNKQVIIILFIQIFVLLKNC